MATPDQIRLMQDRARPRVMEMWWALRPLTSVIRFMQSGAHPDDEDSGMLAALAVRDGLNLSYACSTRGEGGQNDIGTEAGADLGTLRTREMERACDVLAMRMYWLSETPDDSITDFGFSKSGKETLGRWGHDRTLARFVEILRIERPDILMPTFLDVPGQHGHHRAMTQAAIEAMTAAADPSFASNLAPWQVKKLYLPAWSGAGQAYDDDEPPPPTTLVIDGAGGDPVSGWSWDRIGQQSRAYHRTQGMGRWVPAGAGHDWPLHLAEAHVAGPDTAVWAGLPRGVADLAQLPGAESLADDLGAAGAAIDAAIAAFPAFDRVAEAAATALSAVRRGKTSCPDEVREDILHRLEAKEAQLGHVLRLALGIEARGRVGEVFLAPGRETSVVVECDPGAAETVSATLDLPAGWRAEGEVLALSDDAAPSDPYRAAYDPVAPDAPALRLAFETAGEAVALHLPFEIEPVVLPKAIASVMPDAALVNLAGAGRSVTVAIGAEQPAGAEARVDLPVGWTATVADTATEITLPGDVAPGLYDLPVEIEGTPASAVRRMAYDHVAPTARARPAVLNVRVLEAQIPDVRVGYIGGGNDRIAAQLAAMGADVTELSDADLASDAALAHYDSIVIGIFAMRFRAGLLAAMSRLNAWAEAGGTLVTLYHRPWDNWDPETVPPRRLEIGQPSLRWRVTDERAEVRHLADHPLLATPNRIGPADWDGWVKERGLYFAKSWDAAYTPLLEMADPGEAPHRGALLVADVGAGRHVHCALILHHQMANLVPGAFRLMANLIARRE